MSIFSFIPLSLSLSLFSKLIKIIFMSMMILRRLSRLGLVKPALVVRRSSHLRLLLSRDLSSSLLQNQTPPCTIIGARWCEMKLEKHFGKLVVDYVNKSGITTLDKKVSLEVVHNVLFPETVTIGASHGWVATLNDDEKGILCLHDDLKPVVSDREPKRIPLPPLVTLPGCQTQMVTNVAMSTSSPEDEDCVVAVKFLGPQLSFCRPAAGSKPEWTNIRIEHPCFFSSPVVAPKKDDDMFRILGSGGHVMGSWDPCKPSERPKLQMLRFKNFPKLPSSISVPMDSCSTTEHLMESRTTGETFLIKWYKKTTVQVVGHMETESVMVFKLDEQGNAVYTLDIGDLSIFLSKYEPFCVPASSFPGLCRNMVYIQDVHETAIVNLLHYPYISSHMYKTPMLPFFIPPQNID